MAAPSAEPQPFVHGRPASLTDLFWSFTWLALQGFGGVLAVVQRELVDRKKWLTREEFVEDWAVAQILPGPNVVNLSLMLGDRYFGLRGALAALAGMLVFPLMGVLLLAVLFAGVSDSAAAQGALRGMGAVVAGLIVATGLKLMSALNKNVMGVVICAALAVLTFIAIAWMRIPLVWVLLGLGGVGSLWSWHQLGRVRGAVEK
ncbi:MAG: chromate transporter [Rhodoferax sp.]|nr:chromate transporter [Rhodoferax sp.]